MGGVDHCTYL